MTVRILIMGLPGAGKTTLATQLLTLLPDAIWLNADEVRKQFDDWDFSTEGRIRQSNRMRKLADESQKTYAIADFVCPLPEMRINYDADWVIWVDTIKESKYKDTNKAFVHPSDHDFRVREQDAVKWASIIANHVLSDVRRPKFDWKKETVQMLGRWQPWHAGHRALFERLLQRTNQVCIMIRDCEGWQESNPFNLQEVESNIRKDLDPLYQGMYEVIVVPNIVHIGWGRGVGYTSGEETFDESITSISGTEIRREMGLK